MSVIALERISKSYGSISALDSVDLSVDAGEFVTLLGPSGSGKTTLLNIIAGMTSPSSGRLLLNGADATRLPPAVRGIGMVFQNYALLPHMTVFDNVAFPLRVRKVPRREIAARVTEALELVQLPHVAQRRPRELSGGQQQRISLARCIVYRPSLILMDEPLGALDRKLRQQMQLEIRRLHKMLKLTLLYVTHDQEEALSLSDRIVLMQDGRIKQVGSPRVIYDEPRSIFAADFMGDSNLLHGTVVQVRVDEVEMEIAGGRRVFGHTSAPLSIGENVTAVVRPEHVMLLQGSTRQVENIFSAGSEERISAGSTCRQLIDLGHGITVARLHLSGTSDPVPDEPFLIGWRRCNCLILPTRDRS